MEERYSVEEFSKEISVGEYLERFHNPDEVWGYCRACPNYGKQWGCPPFDFDVVERLSRYSTIRLIATKITLLDRSIAPSEINSVLRPERVRLERRLLEMERDCNGLACTYIGECMHCAEGSCSRLCGAPCRHPDLIRPSLEAYGFDVVKTLCELFGLDLEWSTATTSPSHIILTTALLYSSRVENSR